MARSSAARRASEHPADVHNRQVFQALWERLKREPKPIAFIGAGVSVDAGYPTWKTLLSELHKLAFPHADDRQAGISRNQDSLWRAQVYRQQLARGYFPALRRLLVPANRAHSRNLAAAITRLGFAHYLTTNYESVLTDAVNDRLERRVRVINALESTAMRAFLAGLNDHAQPCVIHLHGSLRDIKNMILTEDDYLRRYRGSHRAERELFAVLSTRQVVFIGFSLTDPDLMEILRVMRGEDRGAPRHFAILPLEGAEDEAVIREYYQRKFGIQPVFYLPAKDHEALGQILHLLGIPELALDRLPSIGAAVTTTRGPRPTRTPLHPDDPQKGLWGGLAQRNGRRVTAQVTPSSASMDWFKIVIHIEATNRKPLRGPVTVHVHDSFREPYYRAEILDRKTRLRAELVLHAYGAFTIGVVCDAGDTLLELDLADLADAPKAFRDN